MPGLLRSMAVPMVAITVATSIPLTVFAFWLDRRLSRQ